MNTVLVAVLRGRQGVHSFVDDLRHLCCKLLQHRVLICMHTRTCFSHSTVSRSHCCQTYTETHQRRMHRRHAVLSRCQSDTCQRRLKVQDLQHGNTRRLTLRLQRVPGSHVSFQGQSLSISETPTACPPERQAHTRQSKSVPSCLLQRLIQVMWNCQYR